MNSLFSEFSGNLEGYFWRCLRLFRVVLGGILEVFWRVLEGFGGKNYYYLTYKKLRKNLLDTIAYYLKQL